MPDIPLNPALLENAVKIVSAIKSDPAVMRKCSRCGSTYFFMSSEQINLIADLISVDQSDSLCNSCDLDAKT